MEAKSEEPTTPVVVTVSGEPKKPSYLNLACCVNGYSNLTTYDSKFRQNISKSREVSPIRPINATTTTCQPTVTSGSGHLGVPNYFPTTNQPLGYNNNGFVMDPSQQSQRSVMSPEKRLFTAHIMQSATLSSARMTNTSSNGNGLDITDNVAVNGESGVFRSTKYIQQRFTNEVVTKNGNGSTVAAEVSGNGSPCKSFIEQRVERLYGPGALAQGFHANRRSMEKTVLAERNIYSNTPSKWTNRTPGKAVNGYNTPKNGDTQSPQSQFGKTGQQQTPEDTIPVLRHLRPEFRAQLPISSPKRSPPPKDAAGGVGQGVHGASARENGGNHHEDEDSEVLVTQPMTLQFQTVSISKLQTTIAPVNNGTCAKTGTEDGASQLSNDDRATLAVDSSVTKSRSTNNAETIENNNNTNANRVESNNCAANLTTLSTVEEKSGLGAAAVGGGDNKQHNSSIESSKVPESVNASNKMPTKQEIANKENAMVQPAVVGKGVEKDGNYFVGVMNVERNRILALADHCDTYLDQVTVSQSIKHDLRCLLGNVNLTLFSLWFQDKEDGEELVGIIRAASGKARLLSAQKMNQFQGECCVFVIGRNSSNRL